MELLIVAAGNGTRFKDVVPKPLAEIDGVPNIFNTVFKLGGIFSKIIITVSDQYLKIFKDTLESMYDRFPDNSSLLDKVELIVIESGYGSGHAVLLSLYRVKHTRNEQTIVTWGDAHFNDDRIAVELQSKIPTDTMVIPVAVEYNAYLTVSVNSEMKGLAVLSEVGGDSYHDQSIFLVNPRNMIRLLTEYEDTIVDFTYTKLKYKTVNGEFGFLYVVKYMASVKRHASVYVTEFPVKSYNDMKELSAIREANIKQLKCSPEN